MSTAIPRLQQSFLLLLLLMTLGAVLSGCDPTRAVAPKLDPQDPAWSRIIHSHSAGVLSRTDRIRVVFAGEIVEPGRVGQSAAKNLEASPSIQGSAVFASTREIVLTPEKDLQPGGYYRLTVRPAGLAGLADSLKPYEFVVQVAPRQFEVRVEGLAAEAKNDRRMVLRGSVVSSDAEAPEAIERLLVARHLGNRLALEWQHAADGRRHDFSVSGIERQRESTSVALGWDGGPLGAGTKGERAIEVPPQGEFRVAQVQAFQSGGEQYIQVFFSDNLDAKQNLRGLVRLGTGDSTQRVEGNVVRIYPERALQGDVAVVLEAGIRNARGERLQSASRHSVAFAGEKPQVRFVGKGVILPEAKVLSVPFEALNARSVRVSALRVYESNLGQFLQVNKLDGQRDLSRVGRSLWRKTIHLPQGEANRWNRYALDVTELFEKHPGGLFRLTVSITRADSTYTCPGGADEAAPAAPQPASADDLNEREASSWDYAEEYYGADGREQWRSRENPCSNAYYRFAKGTRDARNFLASNIGMLAKRDQRGRLLVSITDLRTAKPLRGAKVTAMNFQNQPMASGSTDADGMATLRLSGAPFYLLAEKDGQKGYLKVSPGTALPVSHFDVGGEKVAAGLKGHIYGERGVWRPGDDIFLTFALQDADKSLPANHPVTLELRNPQSQLVQTLTSAAPVGSFYAFAMKTAPEAPTGDWTVKAILGGATFSRTLKVETVMPNRLKIELDLGKGKLSGGAPLAGKLSSQWLTGASAAGLNAEVKMRLAKSVTRFETFTDFVFDDPARESSFEPETIFEGALDESGTASFAHRGGPSKDAPGMLSATLTTRVFEPGGAFSVNRQTTAFSPYDRYVGLKLPKGDSARNMLLTDKPQVVELASLSAAGKPLAVHRIEVTLYKVEWKWWWDKSGDSLAQYAAAAHSSVVQKDIVSTGAGGQGTWSFEIKYPQWGRYLARACDLDGGHCTGQVFYIDWPAWAGRAQEQAGPGASVLSFNADKEQYAVGEKALIQLPEASRGRALVTVENGSGILEARWVELEKSRTRFEVPITRAMSPNVYVALTLIQPHAEKPNDRPIRLYGVIPLSVVDPQTRLKPLLGAADEWAPESKATLEVSEASGREMTYTVALVDEGLLGLTNFKTPDLHEQFYKREALGVATWDLFDDVAGAYGAELERLLALGGSDAADANEAKEDRKRFPPVVKFLGPFQLKKGAKNRHEVQLPAYVGSVRAMLVAGEAGAYGSAEKSVYVRQPLMILPTLPRTVGPEEEVVVPVSIFVMDPAIKQVTLELEADSAFQLVGGDSVKVAFARPEEKIGMLKLRTAPRVGRGKLSFVASAGQHQARAEVFLEVRSPNPATTRAERKTLAPGETWETSVVPHGLPGTNVVTLEVSAVPPLDLERRLDYLVRYPHGCLEQVTSGAFPQLFLPSLLKLEDARKKEIESNVHAAIERLRGFQQPNGAFAYWPGGFWGSGFDARSAWSTTYAGHFLVEAAKLGYSVPASMHSDWLRFQKQAAQAWTAGSATTTLEQAYRLYTLAAANQPEVGAMNRLRETRELPSAARWMLAAAYKLAGMSDAANDLVRGDRLDLPAYAVPDETFGSRLRDSAVALNSIVLLGQSDRAKPLADEVSAQLTSEGWHSTQSVAFALMAMSRFAGGGKLGEYTYERSFGSRAERAKTGAPVDTAVLKGFPAQGAPLKVRNTSERTLFASVLVRGIPKAGDDAAAASGLSLEVAYRDRDHNRLELARLRQGQDIVAEITVRNTSAHRIDNIALTQMVPAGYEIHNERMDGADTAGRRSAQLEHLDIRDDRVLRYFGLNAHESVSFTTRLTAAYLGRFYLPSTAVEAMYDATKNARTKGQWVEVIAAGR